MLIVNVIERKMSRIFITSDTHWNHTNIVDGCSKWEDKRGCRKFKTLDEHNRAILDGINNIVKHDDILYHLGDFSFGGHDNVRKFREQINCQTIHLCRGNHDEHVDKYSYCFSSIQDVLTLRFGKHKFFMSHYPHLSWNGASKGVIMVHGHEHDKLSHLNVNCKRMDVGVDSAFDIFSIYRPFMIEEVIDINDRKTCSRLGHH